MITRKPHGWRGDRGGHRGRDWLTHRQLKARTGRASEALCRAIETLVRRGLIEVMDEAGQALGTAAERRRCGERLRFRLSPRALGTGTATGTQEAVSESRAALSLSEEASPFSEKEGTKGEKGVSLCEFRKAKTTKETRDKRSPYGGEPSQQSGGRTGASQPMTLSGDSPTGDLPARQRRSAPADPNVRRFLLAYQQEARQHTAEGEPLPLSWGRDGKLVKGLLAVYGYDRLLVLLERFFASEEDWIRERGYSVPAFFAALGALLVRERQEQKRREAAGLPLVIHGASASVSAQDAVREAAAPSAWRFTRECGWVRAASVLPKQRTGSHERCGPAAPQAPGE